VADDEIKVINKSPVFIFCHVEPFSAVEHMCPDRSGNSKTQDAKLINLITIELVDITVYYWNVKCTDFLRAQVIYAIVDGE
jgi:hypothetical protein